MKKIWMVLLILVLPACESQQSAQLRELQQNLHAGKSQLVKIMLTNPAQVDSVRSRGVELIVVAEDYLIARVDLTQSEAVSAMALAVEPVDEDDLVQRLVRIAIEDSEQIQQLADMGLDLWEIREDSVVAGAYDGYLFELERQGFAFDVLAKDTRDVGANSEKSARK